MCAELEGRGIGLQAIEQLKPILNLSGANSEKIDKLAQIISSSEIGMAGVSEMRTIFGLVRDLEIDLSIELDLSLARGLNYYTGAIFEVKANDFEIGSICGGGRYDDLTGIFGMPNMSGVGISFGADRIYDVMCGLELFPNTATQSTKVMFVNLGEQESLTSLTILTKLRSKGISAEIYPDSAKIKKQMEYANKRAIPYVVIIGSSELETQMATLKNMDSGEQESIAFEELHQKIK